jgi:hypothetical protein
MSAVIGCDSFLALRNVRTGELGRWLADTRLHVWVDPKQLPGSRAVEPEGTTVSALDPFDVRHDPALERRLSAVGFARKCYGDPATIWADFLYSSWRHNSGRPLRKAASIGRAASRFGRFWLSGCFGGAERRRAEFAETLRRHPIAAVYRQRLEEMEARVVASFAPEGMREMALIEAANSLGLPTLVMVRSRDNLASKIPYLPYASRYLVWSSVLKDFLLAMYPETLPDRVHVTGAPQFDHHLDPLLRLSRNELFARIGLDPRRPLILYTMTTPSLLPHEVAIVQHLADAAHAGRFVRGAQLLVRGHPRMFGSKLKLLQREYREARYYPRPTEAEYGGAEHEAHLVRHVIQDEPVHLSLLAHQDVQVNVCGTMTIDSAIFDKPIVNVYYDLPPGIPAALSARRFYKRSDTRQMMSYGASRLAHAPDECLELINQYLTNPGLDTDGRRRARLEDCGPLDGGAGLRTSCIIRTLLQEHPALAASL